ncbi:MAG: ABC transporter permease [Saprospiraceae bacterium]|nr:ABC transporter permease [Saprospiraceae bacterium]
MATAIFKTVLEQLPENNRIERIWKLAQFDFMRRYYNDRLGLVWALLNPLFQIVVYYLVFTRVFGNRDPNFVLFLSSGILFWGVFAEITRGGMAVIRSKRYLIENIQFDKLDLFVSYAISVFMAFLFNLAVYVLLALILDANLNSYVLYVIPLLFNVFLLSVAVSMLLSVLVLFFDDVRHLWDMLLFVGFWGSGVIYSMDLLVEKVPVLGYLNPFIGLLKNCRNALLYGQPPDFLMFFYDFAFGFFVFFIALMLFRKTEHLILEKR